jgi:hypothetical protein
MAITLIATYENGFLRLPRRLNLPDHTPVQIQIEAPVETLGEPNLLQSLVALATDLGVADLAEQHDRYLYGTDETDHGTRSQ